MENKIEEHILKWIDKADKPTNPTCKLSSNLHSSTVSEAAGSSIYQSTFKSTAADQYTFNAQSPSAINSSSFKTCVSLARLYKLMEIKRQRVERLRELNDETERMLAEDPESITLQFRHTYAILIVDLDKINQELKCQIDLLLQYVSSIAEDHDMVVCNINEIRRKCDDEAQEMITRLKFIQSLSDQRTLGTTAACVEEVLRDLRQRVHPMNLQCFELTVEQLVIQIIHTLSSHMYYQQQIQTTPQPPPQYQQQSQFFTQPSSIALTSSQLPVSAHPQSSFAPSPSANNLYTIKQEHVNLD